MILKSFSEVKWELLLLSVDAQGVFTPCLPSSPSFYHTVLIFLAWMHFGAKSPFFNFWNSVNGTVFVVLFVLAKTAYVPHFSLLLFLEEPWEVFMFYTHRIAWIAQEWFSKIGGHHVRMGWNQPPHPLSLQSSPLDSRIGWELQGAYQLRGT